MAAEITMAASLTAVCIDAQRFCRILVLAHRDQPHAETRALDQLRYHERYADQRQDDPIERGAALKLERPNAQIELDQCARRRRR